MVSEKNIPDYLNWFLKDGFGENTCLFKIEELMHQPKASIDEICNLIIAVIPLGWQHSDICKIKISIENKVYSSPYPVETTWFHSADIVVHNKIVGDITVFCTEKIPSAGISPHLEKEIKLLNTIANRLGHYLAFRKMKNLFHRGLTTREELEEQGIPEWRIVLYTLQQTAPALFERISLSMLVYLYNDRISEAEELIKNLSIDLKSIKDSLLAEISDPHRINPTKIPKGFSDIVFKIARKHYGEKQIFSLIKKWLREKESCLLI